uniref:RING-type domain-containing protein n=1 Tax=Macrostomum lignano TaxID=282301 RepID=A0A1I8HNA5_9PLAT
MVGRRRQSAKNAKGKAPEVPAEPEIEEETYFLNPDAVSPHLYCCICQEVFKEPWRAPCGHSFCKRCIFDWLQKNAICPSDRKPVTVGQLHHDFLVQNIIDDYIVACPWRALGCNNVGPLHQLKEHKKICPLNPNTMPKVLQDYSVQMLSSAQEELQRKQAATTTAVANAASTVPKSDTAAAGPDDSSFDDDDANLPGGQLPSLRMRLYVNSQAEGRNEYVNFLENLTTRPQLLQVPESISRYCCEQSQPPDSKRPRLGDD